MASVTVVADAAAFAAAAAERITEVIGQSIAERGTAFIALAGGQTPRPVYDALADDQNRWRQRIDWRRVHVFWGDERHVPPQDGQSNFRLANEALLRHVPIPADHIHRIPAEMPDAFDAARAYEDEMCQAFGREGRAARFDLVLLGLGEDAHVASLFPGSSALTERHAYVAAPWVPHLNSSRITLTPTTLLEASAILVLAVGSNKALAVQAALEQPIDIPRWPAQMLRAVGDRVVWILDEAAASLLHTGR